MPGSQHHAFCTRLCIIVVLQSSVCLRTSLFATSHDNRTVKIQVQQGDKFTSHSHTVPLKMASETKKTTKMKAQSTRHHGLVMMTDADTSPSLRRVLPAELRPLANGLPGVDVNKAAGPCHMKGTKMCSCQKYSEVVHCNTRNPGCRECTHSHSFHNGCHPEDGVQNVVREILTNFKVGNRATRGNLTTPFRAAQHKSNLGYCPKDRVRNIYLHGNNKFDAQASGTWTIGIGNYLCFHSCLHARRN